MPNKELAIQVTVGGVALPTQTFDPTKDDKAENAIDFAENLIDLSDATPLNGKIDYKTVVKVGPVRIPFAFSIDVTNDEA